MVADVGARIRALRTARGLTQAPVAQPSYTKASISMLESGRTCASMKALEHIAGVLGVQPSDLLGGQAVPDAPQYQLFEARRSFQLGRWREAAELLEQLEQGLTPPDQLVRLRYLATAYNADGHPKQAFSILASVRRFCERTSVSGH